MSSKHVTIVMQQPLSSWGRLFFPNDQIIPRGNLQNIWRHWKTTSFCAATSIVSLQLKDLSAKNIRFWTPANRKIFYKTLTTTTYRWRTCGNQLIARVATCSEECYTQHMVRNSLPPPSVVSGCTQAVNDRNWVVLVRLIYFLWIQIKFCFRFLMNSAFYVLPVNKFGIIIKYGCEYH